MAARNRSKGFFYLGTPPIDQDWDDDGGVLLARCLGEIERHGMIAVHPDGYDAAPLRTPLLSHPGDDRVPFEPQLPQLRTNPQDMQATPGHWLARRHARDRLKTLPPEEMPPPPPLPKLRQPRGLDGRYYHPGRPPAAGTAMWGEPPPWPEPVVTQAPPPLPNPIDVPVSRPPALSGARSPLPKPFVIFSWPAPSEFK